GPRPTRSGGRNRPGPGRNRPGPGRNRPGPGRNRPGPGRNRPGPARDRPGPRPTGVRPDVGLGPHTRRMDSAIPPGLRAVVAEQAGVVNRNQLLRAGVSRNAASAKVRHGRWRTLHPGVYATFTGAVSWEARLWAAALYC